MACKFETFHGMFMIHCRLSIRKERDERSDDVSTKEAETFCSETCDPPFVPLDSRIPLPPVSFHP